MLNEKKIKALIIVSILLIETFVWMANGPRNFWSLGLGGDSNGPGTVNLGDGSGNARTMIPMRFVAEALGKSVYWDAANKLVVITEPDKPWKPERSAEKQMTDDVLIIFSPLMRDLI
jgi:hypothetical protein